MDGLRRGENALTASQDSDSDELSQINRIIFKVEKIIIPTSLREEILTKIHAGHMLDTWAWKSANREHGTFFFGPECTNK